MICNFFSTEIVYESPPDIIEECASEDCFPFGEAGISNLYSGIQLNVKEGKKWAKGSWKILPALIRQQMENGLKLFVPLLVEVTSDALYIRKINCCRWSLIIRGAFWRLRKFMIFFHRHHPKKWSEDRIKSKVSPPAHIKLQVLGVFNTM